LRVRDEGKNLNNFEKGTTDLKSRPRGRQEGSQDGNPSTLIVRNWPEARASDRDRRKPHRNSTERRKNHEREDKTSRQKVAATHKHHRSVNPEAARGSVQAKTLGRKERKAMKREDQKLKRKALLNTRRSSE